MRIQPNYTIVGLLPVLIALLLASPIRSQTSDLSPHLLIESGPSDNPAYRRMVFVKYLQGPRVSVAYKAYNRTEFIQIEDDMQSALALECSNGAATPLEEIDAFQEQESLRRTQNTPPEIARFCIKNVNGWEAGNRARYLDPIFDGMPYAASLND